MDRVFLYSILYALAAQQGREEALFGHFAPRAQDAFVRSLAGKGFPELWFELPLAGKPWFDLHVASVHNNFGGGAAINRNACGGVPEAFEWFATQGRNARQIILSWDTGSGNLDQPAVQMLRRTNDTQTTCDFLAAVGRSDAVEAYRAFEARLPKGWFACYTGVFPQRRVPFLRVECMPRDTLQLAYARDPALLADHLAQVGMAEPGSTLLSRCQALAATPFQLEFQFDVTPEGRAAPTFSASVRFAQPTREGGDAQFDVHGAAGELMEQVQEWGLADERWRLLSGTSFAKRISVADASCVLWCLPAFLKLRWRDGAPLDAKSYLVAGVQDG